MVNGRAVGAVIKARVQVLLKVLLAVNLYHAKHNTGTISAATPGSVVVWSSGGPDPECVC